MSTLNSKNFFGCFLNNDSKLLESLQALYDSEISYSISTFWDGGFDVKLGNEMSGSIAESNFSTLRECIYFLVDEAIKHYPDSKFAKNYKD